MKFTIPVYTLLSERERQVIEHTLSGISPNQIARLTGLECKTVYTYRMRAFDKLGISSDAELFQWYSHSLAAKHGDSIPAVAILRPSINHLAEAA